MNSSILSLYLSCFLVSYPGSCQIVVDGDNLLHGVSADKEGRVSPPVPLQDLPLVPLTQTPRVVFPQHSLGAL